MYCQHGRCNWENLNEKLLGFGQQWDAMCMILPSHGSIIVSRNPYHKYHIGITHRLTSACPSFDHEVILAKGPSGRFAEGEMQLGAVQHGQMPVYR